MMVTNTQLPVVVMAKVVPFFFFFEVDSFQMQLYWRGNNPEQFQLVIRAGPELENSDYLTMFPP